MADRNTVDKNVTLVFGEREFIVRTHTYTYEHVFYFKIIKDERVFY